MKRNLTGEDAFLKMISTSVPDKTDSYTPIRHQDVIVHIRKEVMNAKFIIVGEDYKCTAAAKYNGIWNEGGSVGLGITRIKYKEDPDLVLTATFLNSYNRQYAFRFALGAEIKVDGKLNANSIMLQNEIHGFYRRVHTGAADIMTSGTITDLIANAHDYWQLLVDHKNKLKDIEIDPRTMYWMLGELFIGRDIIMTLQLNIIKKTLLRLGAAKNGINGWIFYNAVAEGIRDTHPAEWMDVHARVHDLFAEMLSLDPAGSVPAAPAAVFPGASASEDDEEEEEEDAAAMATAAGTGTPFAGVTP